MVNIWSLYLGEHYPSRCYCDSTKWKGATTARRDIYESRSELSIINKGKFWTIVSLHEANLQNNREENGINPTTQVFIQDFS